MIATDAEARFFEPSVTTTFDAVSTLLRRFPVTTVSPPDACNVSVAAVLALLRVMSMPPLLKVIFRSVVEGENE